MKLKIKVLDHQTQKTFEQVIDGDYQLWINRRLKQLVDENLNVFTVLEVQEVE